MRRTEDRPDRIAWEVHTSMGDVVELQFMIDGAALHVGEAFVPLSTDDLWALRDALFHGAESMRRMGRIRSSSSF